MINNLVAEEEWVNPAAPPAFEDIGEGLAHLDQIERDAIKEMEAHAAEAMNKASQDPAQQQYFMRVDRRTVVKTEEEYVRCQLAGTSMKVVPYAFALQLLKEESARTKARDKNRKNKKAARASKKRNR